MSWHGISKYQNTGEFRRFCRAEYGIVTWRRISDQKLGSGAINYIVWWVGLLEDCWHSINTYWSNRIWEKAHQDFCQFSFIRYDPKQDKTNAPVICMVWAINDLNIQYVIYEQETKYPKTIQNLSKYFDFLRNDCVCIWTYWVIWYSDTWCDWYRKSWINEVTRGTEVFHKQHGSNFLNCHHRQLLIFTLIARFMGPALGPSGAQVGPMLAPWTLLSR